MSFSQQFIIKDFYKQAIVKGRHASAGGPVLFSVDCKNTLLHTKAKKPAGQRLNGKFHFLT